MCLVGGDLEILLALVVAIEAKIELLTKDVCKVGEVWCEETKVGVREAELAIWLPISGQVVVACDYGEWRGEIYVCSGRADDCVDWAVNAIFGDYAVFGEVIDRILNEGEIVLGDSFEITRTRRKSTAEWREVRNHLL